MSKETPNPGSEAAGKLGCTCAIMDNNCGREAPFPPDGWWITADCPVHHPGEEARSAEPREELSGP